MYLSWISFANDFTRFLNTIAASSAISRFPLCNASSYWRYASKGNFESIGRYTGSSYLPGSFTAYSTRVVLPGITIHSVSYWSGVSVSSRILPSCHSPQIPRVFTPVNIRCSPTTSRRISSICGLISGFRFWRCIAIIRYTLEITSRITIMPSKISIVVLLY